MATVAASEAAEAVAAEQALDSTSIVSAETICGNIIVF